MQFEIINNIEKIQLDIEYISEKEKLEDYIYNMDNYTTKELKDFMELYIIDQLNDLFYGFYTTEYIKEEINTKLIDLIILLNNEGV